VESGREDTAKGSDEMQTGDEIYGRRSDISQGSDGDPQTLGDLKKKGTIQTTTELPLHTD
jgi:hypothetical protein